MAIALIAIFAFSTAPIAAFGAPRKIAPGQVSQPLKASEKTSGMKNKNTFNYPDFAFPETVEKNAVAAYEAGVKSGDWINVLKAVMQRCVALKSRKSEAADSCIAILEQTAVIAPAPYNALVYALEASLLSEEYDSGSWQYDSRQIPPGSVPDKIELWSRDIFSSKITDLASSALKQCEGFDSWRLQKISSILSDWKEADEQGFTLGDFLRLSFIKSLAPFSHSPSGNRIPFHIADSKSSIAEDYTSRPYELSLELARQLTSRLVADSKPMLVGIAVSKLMELLPEQDRMVEAEHWADIYKGTASEQGPLCFIAQHTFNESRPSLYYTDFEDADEQDSESREEKRKLYKRCIESLKQFPRSIYSEHLKDITASAAGESLYIRADGQYLPDREITVSVNNSNCRKYSIYAIAVPDSYLESGATLGQAVKGRVVIKKDVEIDTPVPFSSSDKISIGTLPYGVYALLAVKEGSLSSLSGSRQDAELFQVCDLQVLTERRINNTSSLFVVSGEEGMPAEGAEVELQERLRRSSSTGNRYKTVQKAVTNADGRVEVAEDAEGSERVVVRKGGETISVMSYLRRMSENKDSTENVSLFLDRAIAKPGEKIQFELVAYAKTNNHLRLLPGIGVKVYLKNASRQDIDSLSVVTDAYGNAVGSFLIPKEGMLGEWNLVAFTQNNRNAWRYNGSCALQVEEYKAPSFEVTSQVETGGQSGDILIKGAVCTFSGMPVSNSDVKVSIKYSPMRWLRYFNSEDAGFEAYCKTDSEGKYELRLNTADLKETPFENASFRVEVSATDPAGETRTSLTRFALGSSDYISPEIKSEIEIVGEEVRLSVPVRDILGNPVQRKVKCEIFKGTHKNGDSPVISCEFESPALILSADSIPSGKYTVVFRLPDDENSVPVKSELVFWRSNDPVAPLETPIWMPVSTQYAEKDVNKTRVTFGSSYPGQWMLCSVTKPDGSVSESWIQSDGKMTSIEVPAPAEGQRTFVEVIALRNLNFYRETSTILPFSERNQLKVEVNTFRDKIIPGNQENWRFRFLKDDITPYQISAMAVMTDKGLNSLVPFKWFFSPQMSLSYSSGTDFSFRSLSPITYWVSRNYSNVRWSEPIIPVWRYDFPGSSVHYGMLYDCCMAASDNAMVRNSPAVTAPQMKMAKAESTMEMSEEASMEFEAANTGGGSSVEGSSKEESIPLRESECPVAFFMPRLEANDDGEVNISFKVPDFNTTWQFQILGYTPELRTASMVLDAVASKPVMVKFNAPSFLRTGDRVMIAATAYNNTGESMDLGGRIEIFDAVSGNMLSSKIFDGEQISASGSRLMELEFDVPNDVALLAVRTYAVGCGSSDGEQVAVPVLPASSPLLESTPFWIAPGQKEFKMQLPRYDKTASVTLTYCDNPLWYALTALPALTSDTGLSTLSIMRNLYGNCVGTGLLGKYPVLEEGLRDMLAKSEAGKTDMLNSQLENNSSLKIANLEFTPWVNTAKDETLRMHSLGSLLDSVAARKAIDSGIETLLKRVSHDQGLVWCPGGKSSRWVTAQVLLWNSMLMRFGYMPRSEKYESMIRNAISFCEKDITESFKRFKVGDADIESLMNFLYVRSYYLGTPYLPNESQEFLGYVARCLKLVKQNWKSYSLYDKATAATLLSRSGEKKVASEIMSSISEFATRREDRGMWFDAFQGSIFSPWDKLITTAQVLEAYLDVDPESQDVDLLRQWLILQRQAEDWSSLPYGSEIVQVLLSSGSRWTGESQDPEIRLGRKKVLGKEGIPPYGEAILNINPENASNAELKIKRDAASPAWGAVISQYVSPIEEVKPYSIEDIKVTKSIFALRERNGVVMAEELSDDDGSLLRKGDKVRVQLTVETARDMEYVVLRDERGACLRPVDLLSEPDMIDSVWLYREMRNEETNFFIPFLRRGNFQISYDCFISQAGSFATGIATLQSQFAPSLSAHSAGVRLETK